MIALLVLLGCGPRIQPGPAAVAQAADPVRVVTRHDPASPNVYFQAVIAAGSAYDPVGQEGLAALAARSLVEAGAGDRSGLEVADALFPTGNEIEQVVDREWVSLRLTCHRDHAELCLELFTDALVRPRFDPADVERLRDEAVYEVTDGLLEDEERLAGEVLDAWIFEAHPYGHPVLGRAGVLALLDAEKARAFHEAHYVRSAVVGGLAGAWDEELRAAFQARLDALPSTRPPELVLQAPLPIEGRSLLAVDTATPVTGFRMGHPLTVGRDHPDFPALYLAIAAFGAHRQSHGRLYRSLREARGLNYGTYAYAEPFVQRGWSNMPEQGVLRRQPTFSLWIRPTSVDNGPFALKLALAELEDLATEGLEAEELDQVRSWLLGRLPLQARDPGRRLAYALDAEVTGTKDLLETLPAALEALTLEEVNAAVAEHLHPDTLKIVAVSGEADDLVRRLVEETTTPIVYQDVTPGAEQAARDAEVAARPVDLSSSRVQPAEGIFR